MNRSRLWRGLAYSCPGFPEPSERCGGLRFFISRRLENYSPYSQRREAPRVTRSVQIPNWIANPVAGLFNPLAMRKFTKKEKRIILQAQIAKEQVEISDAERDELLRQVQQFLGTDDYYWIKGCIWEVLRYMVTHPPEGEYKQSGVRWLRSEMKKIARKDLQ